MEEKKKVIILVSIALVLAATAIILNLMDSEEVPVSSDSPEANVGGEVGVDIEAAPVEDRLVEKSREAEQ